MLISTPILSFALSWRRRIEVSSIRAAGDAPLYLLRVWNADGFRPFASRSIDDIMHIAVSMCASAKTLKGD